MLEMKKDLQFRLTNVRLSEISYVPKDICIGISSEVRLFVRVNLDGILLLVAKELHSRHSIELIL